MGNLRIHLRQSINTLIYSVIVDKLSSNVENWEAIIHKIVTSKKGNLVGNVNAVDDSLDWFLQKVVVSYRIQNTL